MEPATTRLGHALAKILGIKLQNCNDPGREELTKNESVFSNSTVDTYVEEEPRTIDWVRDVIPESQDIKRYVFNLFPFTRWIKKYNTQWAIGDAVAGITAGAVAVPQSMAYAVLAQLPPEFGLYSSFMGAIIYWFLATSKDVTIGPVAVASVVVGNTVLRAKERMPDVPSDVIASAFSVIAGGIIVFIGLIRCGWVVEFISLTSISAFMTGSALNIAVGQLPALMGITGFSTREATYKVLINTLKHLGQSKLGAAMGLTSLLLLYIIRVTCNYGAERMPHRRKTFFFVATLRNAFVLLIYTMISWLVNRNRRTKPLFKIVSNVRRGLKHAQVPTINKPIINAVASDLPATVIVLLIEQIAICKSFGRVNNYRIDPSQELVAVGVTNLLGPFLGAYPATASFSRTAIMSKAGVRTPLAGLITGIVVLLAIYALPALFFYIPYSSLAAVIIHAVGDLITPPNTVYQLWRVSPLEVVIFFAGVFVTVFTTIENGIYTTAGISLVVQLFRVMKAKGRFLGRVKIHSIVGDQVSGNDGKNNCQGELATYKEDVKSTSRDIFLPIDHQDGSNPEVEVDSPYPGIFIYRFSEGFTYPNASQYLDYLTESIFKQTRQTSINANEKPGDRSWSDEGPQQATETSSHLPTLKAIILDFSSVNYVDVTSVQLLIDTRNQLNRWAAPDTVEWHFACITNRWTKRALVSAGFGYPTPSTSQYRHWKPIFSVAEIGGFNPPAGMADACEARKAPDQQQRRPSQRLEGKTDDDDGDKIDESSPDVTETDLAKVATTNVYKKSSRVAFVHGINRPLFHIDLTSALQSAISNAEWKREEQQPGGDGQGA